MIDVQFLHAPLGTGPLAPDAGLLLREQLRAHLVGIVGLQQLPLLTGQPRQLGLGLADLLIESVGFLADMGTHGAADPLPILIGEPHRIALAVVAFNPGLDCRRPVMTLRASAATTALADEVLICSAVAFGLDEHQPGTALGAEQTAAQVVVMPPGALAALALRIKQILDLLELGLVHQRLVTALVGLAVPAHLPDVVGVA